MHRRLLLIALLVVGCAKPDPATEPAGPSDPGPPIAAPAIDFDQSFDQAVTTEVGPDQVEPVAMTVAGKNTAKLRDEVERLWPTIKLTKESTPVVTLATDLGEIDITLRPDLAPNHVRNFIALVRAEYYDGLRFDRIVNQEAQAPDGSVSAIRLVRFGCPAGHGDPGYGHLGYRLRSEFSDEKHTAGTVGFSRDADPSSAGTRLYITLGDTPVLDNGYTIVGKVTRGLDVVEKVAAGKLLSPEQDPTREMPERPVVIKRATSR